ncbi:lytic polysaccharide monooxygenase auxiliary activity family 9 protein [Streptomyces liangshanensis]|uniref:lytic polysaccharide monooxygenase auxiliary activity family 9 protein n=1 Tax=Streptomyces liangshanensis TaxID=2717324 RepID=UPI0036DA4B41
MIRHRTSAAAAFAGAVTFLLAGSTLPAAAPAYAHGAPTDPVSRVAACGLASEGLAGTPACRAAVAANGGQPLVSWDNLRVAGVDGRDRQVIPDGKLCSGGIAAYAGLDLPRSDWPATRLAPGAPFTLTYRSSIPHEGTFSLYLTRQGYSPDAPLTWDDLAPEPFLTVKDPALRNGAYRIPARLPEGRTGRHVLYTVWRNTSTPDTYYSCSDVVLPGGSTGEAATTPPTRAAVPPPSKARTKAPERAPEPAAASPSASPSTAPSSPSPSPAPASAAADSANTAPVADTGSPLTPTTAALAGAAALAVAALGTVLLRRRRTATAGRPHRRHRR